VTTDSSCAKRRGFLRGEGGLGDDPDRLGPGTGFGGNPLMGMRAGPRVAAVVPEGTMGCSVALCSPSARGISDKTDAHGLHLARWRGGDCGPAPLLSGACTRAALEHGWGRLAGSSKWTAMMGQEKRSEPPGGSVQPANGPRRGGEDRDSGWPEVSGAAGD